MPNSFLTDIYKPNISKQTLNEVANVVLAYCAAASFLIKSTGQELQEHHFMTLMEYIQRGKNTIEFINDEPDSNTYDLIILRAPMSDKARDFIISELDPYSSSFFIVESIIDYLKEDAGFISLVNELSNNGDQNRIIIEVAPLTNSTTLSTFIRVDNSSTRFVLNTSAIFKPNEDMGNIGQKDLAKDYGYEVHRQFINNVLGVDIGANFDVYYQECHNNGTPSVDTIEHATRNLYSEVCRRLNMGFNGAYDNPTFDFKHQAICKMIQTVYGVHPDDKCSCVILPSSGVSYDSLDLDDLSNKLYVSKLKAVCPDDANPSIRIVDGNNKELFQVRLKKESYPSNITGHRYKIYFKLRKIKDFLNKR